MPLDPRFDKAEEALAEFGRKFWDTETEAAERRRLVAALIDRVWQDKGVVVAVKPREPLMRYFQAADELAQRRARKRAKRGFESGSDGTRTRDLRRDRPVRAQPAQPAATRNYRLAQAFRAGSNRLWPATVGYHPTEPV
jgi:hypothetical protein